MSKSKIKVLVVPSDKTGVSYYRSTNPHIALQNKYPDEFEIDIDYEPQLDNDEWLKQYDLIHYHRTLGPYEKMETLVKKLTNMGITTIMDLDDYWAPGAHHPAFVLIKNAGLDIKIRENLRVAQYITTTTPIFAEEISKVNKNVFVLPNGIDPTENQFIPKPEPSNKLRIGWLGGSSHLKDLEILSGLVNKLKSEGLLDKIQFVLCGFDLRGQTTVVDPITKEQKTRPITPMESVWYQYEKIFTDDYKSISPKYKNFLLSFTPSDYPDVANEPYRRVWTRDVSTYAVNYNLFDVSLAPLAEHMFNKCKSQLKVIEAGFHRKAIIAQDFGPYQIDLKNAMQFGGGFDTTANAILIKKARNHKDWYNAIKKLLNNPDYLKALQDNLYETVKNLYSMDNITEQRKDLYLKLVKENKPELV